jgi:hypothetical protein
MNIDDDVTFVTLVGQKDSYYDCFHKNQLSIRERICFNPKISVGEIEFYKINKNSFYGYTHIKKQNYDEEIWHQKYFVSLMTDTKWVIYTDCDTVFVNNTIFYHLDKIQNGIGFTYHWWINTIEDYIKVGNYKNVNDILNIYKTKLNLNLEDRMVSAGVFIFSNTIENRSILSEIYSTMLKYDMYINQGITDEIILSSFVKKYPMSFVPLNGCINHTCNYNYIDKMPLKLEGGILYGKNEIDEEFCPILLLHCDISRRDPSCGWTDNNIKQKIREMFYISSPESNNALSRGVY